MGFPLEANVNVGAEATLHLDTVKLLAEQEYWEITFDAKSESKPASFRKYDAVCNNYVRINVWCVSSTVGVCLDHPRQGKMQVLLRNVSKIHMREIFRSPRECAGYSRLPKVSSDFAIGDLVQVNGYGVRGCALIINIRDHLKDLVKIRFRDGQEYRVHTKELTRAHLGPNPEPVRMGKCQSLKNEAKLQLKRIDRELEKLQQERRNILALPVDLEGIRQVPDENTMAHEQMDDSLSPTTCTFINLLPQEGFWQPDSLQFAAANLESTLAESGAFAKQPPQPSPSHQPRNQDGRSMILPPRDYPGFFNMS